MTFAHLIASRGPQRTGLLCPDCPHDWCYHDKEHGCWFLVGGMSGDEFCECTTKLPAEIDVPRIDADDVLRHYGDVMGWRLGSGRWIVRHRGSTYLVADWRGAVAVNLGEHLVRQVGAYDQLILDSLS